MKVLLTQKGINRYIKEKYNIKVYILNVDIDMIDTISLLSLTADFISYEIQIS